MTEQYHVRSLKTGNVVSQPDDMMNARQLAISLSKGTDIGHFIIEPVNLVLRIWTPDGRGDGYRVTELTPNGLIYSQSDFALECDARNFAWLRWGQSGGLYRIEFQADNDAFVEVPASEAPKFARTLTRF